MRNGLLGKFPLDYPHPLITKRLIDMSKTRILNNGVLVESTLSLNLKIFGTLEQAFLLVQEQLRVFASDTKFSQNIALAFAEGLATELLQTAWLGEDVLLKYMPQKNALFRGITSLLFIPILLSCQMPSHSSQYDNCNKQDRDAFSSCMKKNFPVGSSYSDLKRYLAEQGFTQSKHPDHLKENRFYFFWRANDLSNYKVVVMGRYNNEIKIVEIDIP